MKRVVLFLFGLSLVGSFLTARVSVFAGDSDTKLTKIIVDYPGSGSIFPPEFPAPTFLWHDSDDEVKSWLIEVTFTDSVEKLEVESVGPPMTIGEIDPRCVSPTNELPKLSPKQAEAHTWKPDSNTWETIKKLSVEKPATVTFKGVRDNQVVSRGQVSFETALESVGAPVFYRDVPLMPSELKKGEIKPIEPKLLPYVGWRLRDLGETSSRLLMEGLYTCANCHSFSRDGKTLGMDLDGPDNDKGLYAIVPIAAHTSIKDENVISWKSFRGQMEKKKRIGFMSQVSPDGRYVITATQVQYYVANFEDYKFLQVFYPTRGILAWYDRTDGKVRALPGGDDPRYVQVNAVWSPDGKYLVFARAEARDPYPESGVIAKYPNDPNEPKIQYSLYRIPFNDGKGGKAEPIEGASHNGKSNSFPKISPDGRWIVYVQCKNGQLMRPDGKLYIVPAEGGVARKMNCNTPLMNSWHSFSPNGRWMVFSSKSWSPYTKLFLTHIDEDGNDSPALLVENSTASNRAVNIPEFVNVSTENFRKIVAPAAEFYRLYDKAFGLTEKGQVDDAIEVWNEALSLDPNDSKAHNNLGGLFLRQGKLDEAVVHFEDALKNNPDLSNAHDNLGLVYLHRGKLGPAIRHFRKALELEPESTETYVNLGGAFLMSGRYSDAVDQLTEALRLEPNRTPILSNMAWILATCPDSQIRDGKRAVELAEKAVDLSAGQDVVVLDTLGASYAEAGEFEKAIKTTQQAMILASKGNDQRLTDLKSRLDLYQNGQAFREK